MKRFLQQVHEIYRPLRWPMLGALGFISTQQLLTLAVPYLNSRVIDGLVDRIPINEVFAFAFAVLAVMLLRGTLLNWLRDWYEIKYVDFAIPQRTQEVTLQRMFGFSIGQHTSEHSGIKQSIANRGETSLKNMVEILLYQALPTIMEMVILTAVLFYWSVPIGLIVLCCIVSYAISVYFQNSIFWKDFKKMEKNYINDSRFKREVIDNVGLVIASGHEERAQGECKDSLTSANDFARSVWQRFIIWADLRNGIPALGRFFVIITGIYGVTEGRYSVGELVMFVAWTGNALGNLGNLSPLHRRLMHAYTSVKRYFDMLDIEPEVKEIPNPVRPDKFSGRIEFKGVTFRYPRRDSGKYMEDEEEESSKSDEPTEIGPALDNINLVIEAGETVAFVGESGAGKSTLIHALIRAQDPEKGQIIVDGNDLRILNLKYYRHSIGIVDQSVSLFDQTLRYNITYGLNGNREKIGDHELREVARMSRIDGFWPRLENGFDTVIGERGVKLSGGERQRVGIARALVKDPRILILDEATSNLDSENEFWIQSSIEEISKGRTTIIIAHRFSTIRNVDKIFVFDKGKLVGQGNHHSLAHSCETYQRLIRNQKI